MKKLAICVLALLLLAGCRHERVRSVRVPVLMYHHIDQTGGEDAVISEASFRHQMDVLRENGYTPVSFAALIGWVEETCPLPDKPVCITFDDGYYSTYELAYPILGEYGYPATVFVIGSSVGHTAYKDTSWPIIPHFGLEEMREMVSSGRMAVQSHTWDMHQWPAYEPSDTPRTCMLPLEGETEEEYTAALTEDIRREAAILAEGGVERVDVLAYPLGYASDIAETLLRQQGVRVTLTTDAKSANLVTQGDAESLYDLGRLNMTDATPDDTLLAYLTGATS